MKTAIFLLLTTTLLAQEAPKMPLPTTTAAATTENRGVLVVDPKARSNDYINAFDSLRKDKPTLKIMIRTINTLFQNVIDLSVCPGGTLLLVKVLSNQGTRINPVPVEEVVELSYSP